MLNRLTSSLVLCRSRGLCIAIMCTVILVYTTSSMLSTRYKEIMLYNDIYSNITAASSVHQCSNVLPLCPSMPPGLKRREKLDINVTLKEAEDKLKGSVELGGSSAPTRCQARWDVAIIVSYRNREHQMGPFLKRMHIFLKRQQLKYKIYIVEQHGNELFNRAKLLNVGYVEAIKDHPWDCYAFHDIDMLPEDDRHLYHCSPQPRHLVVSASNNKYKSAHNILLYQYYGGGCLMTPDNIRQVNGWSNKFWGWGGEDDDMWGRMKYEYIPVWRYPAHIARYTMISHKPPGRNIDSYGDVARFTGKYKYDGLSTLKYKLLSRMQLPLYTHLLVHIGTKNDDKT